MNRNGNAYREILVVGSIATLAMAVRMVFFAQWADTPLFLTPMSDEENFHLTALALAGESAGSPSTFLYQPLYSYFLASLYLLFGGNILLIKTIQLFIGVGTVLVCYGLGRELGGKWTGRFSALLSGLYGPQIFFEGQLLAPVLTVPLVAGALWCLLVAFRRERLWLCALAGLFLGLATMGRPNLAVVLPVVAGFMLLGKWSLRHRLLSVAICLGGLVLGLSPSWIHNLREAQGMVPVSASGGQAFFLGNNPQATGALHIPSGVRLDDSSHFAYRESLTRVAERETGRKLTPSEVSSYWYSRGFSYLLEQPGAAALLWGRKLLLALNNHEMPINHPYLLGREVAPILRFMLTFAVVFPFAILGIWFGLRKKKPIGLLGLTALAYLASLVAYYVADRYRILLLPMLFPLAGLGILELYNLVRERHWRSWIAPLVILASAFAFTQIPLTSPSARPRALSGGYNLMGKAEADNGNLVKAEKYFRKAIQAAGEGKGAVPRANLGLLLERRGDLTGAKELYLQSAAADPEYRFCRLRLALMSERSGDLEQALKWWQELKELAADPAEYQEQINRLEKLTGQAQP